MTKLQKLTPGQVGIKNIPTASLKANPHNPRILFDKVPMEALRVSIAKAGILVPLTVYWDAPHWVILDGQRRWMCAKELTLPTVPCNEVAKPSVEENIITMFQIHKLRADWELMPTALKLDVLIKRLKEKRDKELAVITGLDQAVVARCKKLLSFEQKYRDHMLEFRPEQRVKADFFVELYAVVQDRNVRKMDWYKRKHFIDRMLAKYQSGAGLKAVTDFRIMKQRITNAVNAKRAKVISRRLQEYTEDDSLTLDHLDVAEASHRAEANVISKNVAALAMRLKTLDAQSLYGEESLWKELEDLAALIQKILTKNVDRRLGQKRESE